MINNMERTTKTYTRVAISDEAYTELRRLARLPEYHGKGGVGVLDKLLLGRFTTEGSGRVLGSKNKKSLEKGL